MSVSATASIDALNFDSPEQEKDYHQLTQELRCPQCQNNNIADSNATIAVDMRGKVFELLQEGKNRNEVVDYMIQRYGNFVTYDPPMRRQQSYYGLPQFVSVDWHFYLYLNVNQKKQVRLIPTRF